MHNLTNLLDAIEDAAMWAEINYVGPAAIRAAALALRCAHCGSTVDFHRVDGYLWAFCPPCDAIWRV